MSEMTEMTEVAEPEISERSKVESWRLHVLIEAGYPLSQPLEDRPMRVRLADGRVWVPKDFGDRYDGRGFSGSLGILSVSRRRGR